MRVLTPAALAILALGGCSDDRAEDADPEVTGSASQTPQPPKPPSTSADTGETDGCERDASGQVDCLKAAFDLESCDDAAVLGSAHSSSATDKTFNFRTAYGVKNACRAELEAAIKARGFRDVGKGQFVSKREPDYRESVIFGLQTSPDGSVIEWERIHE